MRSRVASDRGVQGDDNLGLTNLEIKLTTDVPVYYRLYRLSQAKKAVVRDMVHNLLQAGVVQESQYVLVPKKSGEVRLCVDYRAR